VTVTRDQHRLFVEVADDGVGFEPLAVRESGIGLAGMHERAELLNANLRITSAPGRGTRVSLDVPLAPMSAGALT
jgi:signal transduction histidine kinase